MTYYLLLTRPKFEAPASQFVHAMAHVESILRAHQIINGFTHPCGENPLIDITYPRRPHTKDADVTPASSTDDTENKGPAIISGYIFVRFADPTRPLPEDMLRRSICNIRYLKIFSHEIPDPVNPNARIPIYKPYTLDDHVVRALPSTLRQNQCQIVQSLIGRKIRIPSGICMGMTGKIKKITQDPKNPDDPIILVKVVHDGVFSKTHLSFTLQELT